MKLLDEGTLRHRIAIQERVDMQDGETGDVSHVWVTVNDSRGNWSAVAAAIMAASAREFEAAAAVQAETSTRFVIRWRAGVLPTMRLVHKGRPYNIRGVLPDADSGLEYLTLTCTDGVNDGA